MKLINKNGFALLYSLLLAGAVLMIGVILMSIVAKQLVFSSLNRSSETTYYYLANSGRECLSQAITKETQGGFIEENVDDGSFIVRRGDYTLNCFDQSITLTQNGDTFSNYNIPVGGKIVKLEVKVNIDCIRSESQCTGADLVSKYKYVATSEGYSGPEGDRTVKRTTVYVVK
jgi:hypothetical protein